VRSAGSDATAGTALKKTIRLPQLGQFGFSAVRAFILYGKPACGLNRKKF
jgi:hypothetical protein